MANTVRHAQRCNQTSFVLRCTFDSFYLHDNAIPRYAQRTYFTQTPASFSACRIGVLRRVNLVEEADDLACHVFSPRLLVVHDAGRGGEHDVAELTGWQKLDDPLLHVDELDVVARADHAGLVDAGQKSVIRSISRK